MPRLLTYLGIDQSYTACAVITYTPSTGNVTENVYDFSPVQAGRGPQRLEYIHSTLRAHFAQVHQTSAVARICQEGYAYGSKFHREELGELGGVLGLALVQTFPPRLLHTVAPSAVKKYATGSGRADKDKMLLAVYKRWGYEATGHDAADAYVLARIAVDLDAEQSPALTFQAEVLASIRNPKRHNGK
ncbi:crossover junction endodeoxyribonuclease RuvC [Streptomyces sp. NPDC056500]|uniref:crossover junction endodeoxyribonuclease RuvC n=1 Tax=Streptomyces sp. NPDC056500 TaxID=3345840 RepID=UPI00368B9135